jgi:CBS domain-containing protein
MYVAQICSRNVVTVSPTDEILAAARLMREQHVGYLVVVEPARQGVDAVPVGVLTDRDLVVSVMARNVAPASLTVGDVMTPRPVVIAELDSIDVAAKEMRRIGVRRLPVVGRLGELKGVLSLDDVLDAATSELRDLAVAVGNEQRVESAIRT